MHMLKHMEFFFPVLWMFKSVLYIEGSISLPLYQHIFTTSNKFLYYRGLIIVSVIWNGEASAFQGSNTQ